MSSFIHSTGVAGGFIKTPFALLNASDTGLNGLVNGAAVLSAHGGSLGNGIFSQADFGSGPLCQVWFTLGTAGGFTPNVAGGCISGWWLYSTDGGTTFEAREATPSATVPALGRSPDFVINLYEGGAALAAGENKFSGLVPTPYAGCKVLVQNNCGVTLGAGPHIITCGPAADTFG